MPTTNPRINVTLPPSLEQLVSRMAVLTRSSKSQVLRELLEAAEPALQRAVALMDAASKASKGVRDGLAQALDRTQAAAEKEAGLHLAAFDAMQRDLVAEAEAVKGRRPARALAARAGAAPSPGTQNPPSSNRGVKSRKRTGGAQL